MSINQIKKVNIGEQVYNQLKNQLISGEWKPGMKIPSENELANSLGVSRITVRQALQKLSALGLIETKLGEGSFVKEINSGILMNTLIPTAYLTNADQMQILEFRRLIEIETVALAAEKATIQDINELKDVLKAMKLSKEDPIAFAREDLNFHFTIAKITKNCLIIKVHEILKDILSKSLEDIVKKMGPSDALYYHERILDAISNNNSELAKTVMRKHVNETTITIRDKRANE